jgi:hypothetical protein
MAGESMVLMKWDELMARMKGWYLVVLMEHLMDLLMLVRLRD